ncbi:MAG: tetratricopeptide repeat protein, partial [Bacteroidota bacterium]
WVALVGLAMGAAGCGDSPARPGAPERPRETTVRTVDPAALDRAQSQCDEGEVSAGLATVDSLLSDAETADALVVRALCRWVEFHATGDAAVGELVETDLTNALAQARAERAESFVLARIYSHRAALRRALGEDHWPSTLEDLNAAIDADTSQSLYVLDRAVARMRHGDTAAAVRDLDRFLQLDTVNVARGDLARQLREEMRPSSETLTSAE